jgi:hypothetical protein
MLVSKDPATLDRGIKMIANSARALNALRSADAAAARVGGVGGEQLPSFLPAPNRPTMSAGEKSEAETAQVDDYIRARYGPGEYRP